MISPDLPHFDPHFEDSWVGEVTFAEILFLAFRSLGESVFLGSLSNASPKPPWSSYGLSPTKK